MSCILLNYKQSLANSLVQFGCVDHQTPKPKVNGLRVHFSYTDKTTMHAAMPVDSVEIYMHLHMTTMELDARQGGAMALYGPKVAPLVPVSLFSLC